MVPVLVLVAACLAHGTDYMKGLSEDRPMIADKTAGEIRVLAELQPNSFVPGWFTQTPGHHAVVWRGGKKASEALLAAYVSDADFYDAMVSIGAKPGNNLTSAAWEERKNKSSTAPETRVEGSPVEASVWWAGLSEPLPVSALFNDPNGRGIDLRFGGNKALIPVWRSGCILCLQSCPGGKVSNHSYTIRDYVNGKGIFTLNRNNVPEGRRKAVVIFRLKKP